MPYLKKFSSKAFIETRKRIFLRLFGSLVVFKLNALEFSQFNKLPDTVR